MPNTTAFVIAMVAEASAMSEYQAQQLLSATDQLNAQDA